MIRSLILKKKILKSFVDRVLFDISRVCIKIEVNVIASRQHRKQNNKAIR